MNQPLKERLASPKGKKLLAVCVCLLLAGGGILLLSGHSSHANVPPAAPPMSAKQAMAAARAKLAAEHRISHDPVHAPATHSLANNDPPVAVSASVGVPAAIAAEAPSTTPLAAEDPPGAARPPAVAVVNVQPGAPAVPVAVTSTGNAGASSAPANTVTPMKASGSEQAKDVAAAVGSEDYAAYNRQMDAMQRQIRFMQAQATIADLQRKIEGPHDKQSVAPSDLMLPPPVASPSDGEGTAVSSVQLAAPMARTKDGTGLASVMMVSGKYQAVLNTHGAELTVQEGTPLGDGWVVRAISPTSVTLRKGRQRKTLTIGG